MSDESVRETVESVESDVDVDVVVVGAGVAGLYLLHRLRAMDLSARAFETGDDVGGTWYWNRYPGARCDVQSVDYSYSFDPELDETWEWSERYATQPEILGYLQHVADKHDLRRDITFSTRVDGATWDDDAASWTVRVEPAEGGDVEAVTCRWYVMATGCLSAPKSPDVEGHERFAGEVHFTSRWPHEGVDFTGRRVGVIGTGSSAIQSIPIIASQASEITVFQRTPNFAVPARNGPVRDDKRREIEADRVAYRHEARWSPAGVPREVPEESALQVSAEERERRYEEAWQEGTIFSMLGAFNDLIVNAEANDTAAEFVRGKIRETVDDPDTAESLCPTDYPIGTKRLCLDTNYYETFNEDHVTLVDLREEPIATITEAGIDTAERSFEFDDLVFATGFDAMTGAIVAVDIEGRDGTELKDRWADGPHTYLGLMTVGFPNLFMITGPQSPSVLSNMAVSIEQHVDWTCDAIAHMRDRGFRVMEPTEDAERGWVQHANDYADITLFPRANSWYMGANVPGKARVTLPYVGGVDRYRGICDSVVEQDYLGFALRGLDDERVNDGVVARVQPDVTIMLETMEELQIPEIHTLSVDEARGLMQAMGAESPPGPDVGEIVDGSLPGADGDLDYRLYRPDTPGPHAIVAYFHGGGWVLGDTTSDDPLCRDLCVRSGAVVVSVNYRHAPEDRFPAAADDGVAAVRWIADHATELGGVPGELAVAGWSAGGNVAAVACQQLRDAGGPLISGQLLINPVIDCDLSRASYAENGEGYGLTTALMSWFWDHYADETERCDPKASPIRADDLSGLPPAVIVTCEFDPLRDEGRAYAEALEAAGVDVRHISGRGLIHTAIGAVDVLLSPVPYREEIAAGLRGFFRSPVSATASVG
ncbi:flavin-containing monooxygenase [Ilumatobacter sp.]|uniref:flavin-containing monooxygenase n=1 Tax=Ilumatobacter sp. TaxID=1967498 RepID=UPI003B527EF7